MFVSFLSEKISEKPIYKPQKVLINYCIYNKKMI